MRHLRSLLVLSLCIATTTAQQNGRAQAKAEASAHATAQGGECTTVTHRVVVENGKVVVDERTENGKLVGGGAARPQPLPPLPMPGVGGGPSADEMLRQLQDQVRRQMEAQGGTLPPMPRPEAGAKPVPRQPRTPTRRA